MTRGLPSWAIDPRMLNDGLEHSFADGRSRTGFEQGVARQRRKSGGLMTVTGRLLMTGTRYAIFEDWRLGGDSTGLFTLPVWRDDDYETVTARIVKDGIKPSRRDAMWLVEIKIELEAMTTLSDAQLTAIIGAPAAGLVPWPDDVLPPEPLNADFAIAITDTTVRSDFDSGAVDQNRPFNATSTIHSVSLPLSNYQYKVFRAFWHWRLKDGTRWLTMPIFERSAYTWRKSRFVANSVSAVRRGDGWLLKAQVETAELPASVADDMVIQMLGGDIFAIADRLHQIVHVAYPEAVKWGLIETLGSDIYTVAEQLHQIVHVDYPGAVL